MKKPFKETKLGKLVTEKLPDAIKIVGDVLPDKGALGVLKNIIGASDISPEDKSLLLQEANDFEKEMYELEIKDRDSARNREIEIAKVGGTDWMMYVVAGVVLSLLCFTVYAIFYTELSNKELAHFVAGEVLGFGSSLIFYYYGTSKGSHDKSEIIRKLQ